MIKSLIAGIIIGVFFVSQMIADPHTTIEIAKIIGGKVISVGVPIVKEIVKEVTPEMHKTAEQLVSNVIGGAI